MTISLTQLVGELVPGKTTLLLGAGASVPSGGPTGAELAEALWADITKGEAKSRDLIETSTILERNYGRKDVADAVAKRLRSLKPKGGILAIPQMGWRSLFSTNFDRLIEDAFRSANMPIAVFRSNFDYSSNENATGVKFFKIHGCMSQDHSWGDRSSMLLTESDYETPSQFRQSMFADLGAAFLNGDVLIVGQSLSDPHLMKLAKEVLDAKKQGATGRMFMLVYDPDDLRAPLLEDRGARIAFGGIDEFAHELANSDKPNTPASSASAAQILPIAIVASTRDVSSEIGDPPNTSRMFNGGPATYADISAGSTFERSSFIPLSGRISSDLPVLVITGAAGVGKTTLARQLLTECLRRGWRCWEHRSDFAFQYKHWLTVERALRDNNEKGLLLIDECTHFLRGVNQLVDALSEIDDCALHVVMTANAAQWAPRIKSPKIFSRGAVEELSRLENVEINSLVTLVEINRQIADLVHVDFKKLPRSRKVDILRQRCSADMFVCLKNIFETESLDVILLQEFDQLDENLAEYYRYVAALQAVGARVHRQLIIRMLNLPPAQVAAALEGLHGIVDEYDVDDRSGIYGWTTRHLVIARKITEYKFSGAVELTALFDNIIDNINPSVSIELHSIRDICDADYGIGRLGDAETRQRLYRRLTEVAPGERIPWHRLVREALNDNDPDEAERLLREAEQAVGADAPIDRYKVRLLIKRSQVTPKINDGDRIAILRKAYEVALNNINRHRQDKYSYTTLCDVALQLVNKGESEYLLRDSIDKLRNSMEFIQDADMPRQIRHYEDILSRVR